MDFTDYTLQTIVFGTTILGITSGCLGTFAVLRKQSLLGDAISHAALPGITGIFLLTLTKTSWMLLLGAIISGWVGTILMITITRFTHIKEDTALGIILSVFFGVGLVLLTVIQKIPNASQAGLSTYLFGNAATLLRSDVHFMAFLAFITLGGLILFWKEFKLISFDMDFAKSLGFPTLKIEIILTTLIVISIVIGLQTVGVVLMSAMLIAPAAAARQWTNRLGTMVFLSAFFSALSAIIGALISSHVYKLPTGPTIVLVLSTIVILSLLFAPNRGIVWDWIK